MITRATDPSAPAVDTKALPWLVVIAASAGGVPALMDLLRALSPLPAAIVIVQHRTPRPPGALEAILARVTGMPVKCATADDVVQAGHIYVARADLHLTVSPEMRFRYVDGARVRHVLSSANPLLESASPLFRDRLIAVVLTGSGCDATDGVQSVKNAGGRVFVQNPATAAFAGMPSAAIATGAVDRVLDLPEIAPAIHAIVNGSESLPA
jgi:two-component system chemotaxis response regulator CheB